MIYENVVKRCEAQGKTVFQLEKECELGNGTIGKWREVSPTITKLKRVADQLCCTVDDLLEGVN